MEKKIKHLEMIENVIERMAKNSFELKGLTITLLGLLITLLTKQENTHTKVIYLVFIPILFFWFLDSYYLQMERKYKALYKYVRKKSEEEIDFNMDTRIDEVKNEDPKRINYLSCFISKSEILFYFPVVFIMFLIIFLVKI